MSWPKPMYFQLNGTKAKEEQEKIGLQAEIVDNLVQSDAHDAETTHSKTGATRDCPAECKALDRISGELPTTTLSDRVRSQLVSDHAANGGATVPSRERWFATMSAVAIALAGSVATFVHYARQVLSGSSSISGVQMARPDASAARLHCQKAEGRDPGGTRIQRRQGVRLPRRQRNCSQGSRSVRRSHCPDPAMGNGVGQLHQLALALSAISPRRRSTSERQQRHVSRQEGAVMEPREQLVDTGHLKPGPLSYGIGIGAAAVGVGLGVLLLCWGLSWLWPHARRQKSGA